MNVAKICVRHLLFDKFIVSTSFTYIVAPNE